MIIKAVRIEGLARLPRFSLQDLDRVVRLGGPAPCRRALVEALLLAFGSLSSRRLELACERLGLGEVSVQGERLPEEVVFSSPERLRTLLDPAGDRTLRLELQLELDPLQFRRVREWAPREPQLAEALGSGPVLRVRLGWVFTVDLSVASIAVLGLSLGSFQANTTELRPWAVELLEDIGPRLDLRSPGELDVDALDRCDRSADPQRRKALARMRTALTRPPFQLGELSLVAGPELAFGEELVPLVALGPSASEAVGLAQAVFLREAEILLLEHPAGLAERPRALEAWLARQATEEGSALEQVWLIDPRGGVAVRPEPPPLERALGFPGA